MDQQRAPCRPRGQRAVHRQRALRGGARPITRERAEIGERRDQRSLILLQGAQREVAGVAEQAADRAGEMAMIDAQPLFGSLPADRAHAALLRQQRVVLRRRYTIKALELSVSNRLVIVLLAGLAGSTSPFLDRFLVCLVIGVGALSVFLLVRLVMGTTPCVLPCAVVRVLRESLPAPCVERVPLFCASRHVLCPIEVPAIARPPGRRRDAAAQAAGPAPVSDRIGEGREGSRHAAAIVRCRRHAAG